MAQVLQLTAEVNGWCARAGRALVDQFAIFDDGMTVTDMILEKTFCVDVVPVEKFEFAVTVTLQGRIAVERGILIRERTRSIAATSAVASIRSSAGRPTHCSSIPLACIAVAIVGVIVGAGVAWRIITTHGNHFLPESALVRMINLTNKKSRVFPRTLGKRCLPGSDYIY